MNLVPFNKRSCAPGKNFIDEEFLGFPAWDNTLAKTNWSPSFSALDVNETNEQYVIKADLPGLDKKDIRLSYEQGVLTLSGERKSEIEENNEGYQRVERTFGSFQRAIRLGYNIDEKKIKADYKDGVLTINVPKSDKAKGVNIEVG